MNRRSTRSALGRTEGATNLFAQEANNANRRGRFHGSGPVGRTPQRAPMGRGLLLQSLTPDKLRKGPDIEGDDVEVLYLRTDRLDISHEQTQPPDEPTDTHERVLRPEEVELDAATQERIAILTSEEEAGAVGGELLPPIPEESLIANTTSPPLCGEEDSFRSTVSTEVALVTQELVGASKPVATSTPLITPTTSQPAVGHGVPLVSSTPSIPTRGRGRGLPRSASDPVNTTQPVESIDEELPYASASNRPPTPPAADVENGADPDPPASVRRTVARRGVQPIAAVDPAPQPIRRDAPTGALKQLDEPNKVGKASVELVDVVDVPLKMPSEREQTMFCGLYGKIASRNELVRIIDDQVVLTGVLSLPAFQGRAPTSTFTTHFDRAVERKQAPRRFVIEEDRAIINGHVDSAFQDRMRPGGQTSAKEVASILRGEHRLENSMANRIVPLLSEEALSYDNVTLFASAYILLDYLAYLERNDIGWAPAAVPADRVTLCNIGCADAQVDAEYVTLVEAINAGRVCLHRSELTTADVNCMMMIAQGTGYVQLAARRMMPIHTYIDLPRIRWCIWDTNPIPPVGAEVVTYAQLRAFIIKLVRLVGTMDAAVRGCTIGQTLVNVSVAYPDRDPAIMVMSTIEIERTRLPRVHGRNVVWTLLTSLWVTNMDERLFAREWDTLQQLTADEHVRLGAAVAGVVSLGYSTCFNHFNIIGRNLNAWARREVQLVTSFLDGLLTARPGHTLNAISTMAINIIEAMTGLSIHMSTFVCLAWCSNFNHRPNIPLNEGWRDIWGYEIPYIVRPESMEWAIATWIAEWGLNGPNPKFNLSHETMVYGSRGSRGMYIYFGSKKYYDTRQSNSPYLYVLYGGLAANLITQIVRAPRAILMTFKLLSRSTAREVMEEPGWRRDAVWQPTYNPVTFHITPGTLITYDWEQDVVMAPVYLLADIPRLFWPQMTRIVPTNEPSYTGFVSSNACPQADMIVDSCAVWSLITGGTADLAADQHAANDALANEEN
uniref:Capsid n=1 Tax=Aedes aegypti toti-like virus TaxID=2607731 RepID=A0A5C1K377_9VIRU|nr:capsid [Aedes aegypti toti-like virus]